MQKAHPYKFKIYDYIAFIIVTGNYNFHIATFLLPSYKRHKQVLRSPSYDIKFLGILLS